MTPDDEQLILNRCRLPRIYTVSESTLQNQNMMKLSLATGTFKPVAMYVLSQLKSCARGNIFTLIPASWFIKMTKITPPRNTTGAAVSTAISEYWIPAYGAALHILSDDENQPIAKFFGSVCGMLGFRHYFATGYHSQTIGWPEQFKKIAAQRLLH